MASGWHEKREKQQQPEIQSKCTKGEKNVYGELDE